MNENESVNRRFDKPRVDVATLKAANKPSGPSIFETVKVRRDRSVGDMKFGELPAIIAANFRDTAIAYVIKELQRLEKRFKSDDPVRDALATARNAIAAHLIEKDAKPGSGAERVPGPERRPLFATSRSKQASPARGS